MQSYLNVRLPEMNVTDRWIGVFYIEPTKPHWLECFRGVPRACISIEKTIRFQEYELFSNYKYQKKLCGISWTYYDWSFSGSAEFQINR